MAAVSCVFREHGAADPHAIAEPHLDDRTRREREEDVGARTESDEAEPCALGDAVTKMGVGHDAPRDQTGDLAYQDGPARSADADRCLLVIETRLFSAGMTVATFYPFTQTELFASLHRLPWHLLLNFLMIALTILMVSNVHYPTLPRAGFRTLSGLLGLLLIVVILVFGIWQHDVFLFPLGIVYMSYGVVRAVLLGFFKAPAEDEEAEIAGPIVIDESNQAYGAGPRRGPGAA